MLRSAKQMAVMTAIVVLAIVFLVSCEEAGAGSDDDSPDSYFTYRGETYELDRLFRQPQGENEGTNETGFAIGLNMIGPGVTLEDSGLFGGTGDQAYLEVNTATQDTLTEGTYDSAGTAQVGNFSAGVYRLGYNFNESTGDTASPSTGSVTVSKSGDTYTIEFDVTTTAGCPIEGRFVGTKSMDLGVSAVQ